MKKIFLNERFILTLIVLNSILIFVLGFNHDEELIRVFKIFDGIITVLFVFELVVKIKHFGKYYFGSGWNILDFLLIIISIPTLIPLVTSSVNFDLSYLLVLRSARAFKTFRFIKFIPEIKELINGVKRALKTSFVVLIGMSIYIFIVSIFSYYVFGNSATEYFENPLVSIYTIFKIFTVEGWFEIPEAIVETYNQTQSFFTYLFFIFIVLTGGVLGLSLVNSIFVDAMVSDNNDALEKKISNLESQINVLIKKIDNNGIFKQP